MRRISLGLLLALAACANAMASVSEDLTRQSFMSSVCNIDVMSVSFKIDEAFGEPLLTSRMRWTAGPNTGEHCLSRLTYIWARARTPAGKLVYVKLSPNVTASGDDFGPTATESPDWGSLFCSAPNDTAGCESAAAAKQLYRGALEFKGFEVTTDARTLVGMEQPPQHATAATKDKNDARLESMLAKAVDQAIAPTLGTDKTTEPQKPKLTPEQLAREQQAARDKQAHSAVENVVTLLGSSLAQFTTPAHPCESERVVSNWVQAHGTCRLNFRSEATHRFLCADDGKPRNLTATRSADIDLATDLHRVEPIRVSRQGWASLVLELNSPIRATTEGDYKTNRWQVTASNGKLKDLERLAGSILTLKQYCEGAGPPS